MKNDEFRWRHFKNEQQRKEQRAQRNHRYYRAHRPSSAEPKRLFKCQLPEQLIAIMQRMVRDTGRSGRYNYESVSEAAQDLIRRGIGTCREEHEAAADAWPGLEVMHLLDVVAKQRRQIQTMTQKLREEVNALHEAKADREAIQYFHAVMDAIAKMPPTAHRDAAIKTLKREFPDLVKAHVPGVRLLTLKKK